MLSAYDLNNIVFHVIRIVWAIFRPTAAYLGGVLSPQNVPDYHPRWCTVNGRDVDIRRCWYSPVEGIQEERLTFQLPVYCWYERVSSVNEPGVIVGGVKDHLACSVLGALRTQSAVAACGQRAGARRHFLLLTRGEMFTPIICRGMTSGYDDILRKLCVSPTHVGGRSNCLRNGIRSDLEIRKSKKKKSALVDWIAQKNGSRVGYIL